MNRIELASYAKVNLTLEVSDLRADGYHDIDSIVQIIDIKDELCITRANAGIIEVNTEAKGVPSGKGNLVYRACEAFFEATGIRGGAICELKKNIPAQAGLGGGSGNAAAAIAGLNRLYEAGLSVDKLAEIAAKVGSDGPLFIYGGTVRMRGRGEQIQPLPDAPELHMVVVKPDLGVSTGWAYSEMDRQTDRERRHVSDNLENSIRENDRIGVINNLWNDFDPVVSHALAAVQNAKQILMSNGAETAMLSGSGSAVFGVFPTHDDAESAASKLNGKFQRIFVTKTVGRKVES